MNIAVPVIMYHSVGIVHKNWQWNYLTCPYDVFEDQLKWMKKKNINSISLQQLYNFMSGGADLPRNPVVLTFDDGYLDNWIFAYPLLKKYGFNGTIYINPEFVDPRNIIRRNLEDVWNDDIKIDELNSLGYLSWEEMKVMEKMDVMDIQSHTMTHTWHPKNYNIIDFRHPGDPYIWMTWNNYPDKKPYLQIDDSKLINYGEPVYDFGRAIGTRRYYPDDDLKEYVLDSIILDDTYKLFNSLNYKVELFNILNDYVKSEQLCGRFECDDEYEERLYYELQNSKEIIENKLNKDVPFLCWAGGSISDKAIEIASDIGYVSSTAAKDLNHKRMFLGNSYGEDPSRINRIGVSSYWDGIDGYNSKIKYQSGFNLYLTISSFRFRGRKTTAPISFLFPVARSKLYKLKNKYMFSL